MSKTAAARQMPLRKNFSWTFVGNVVYAAAQWAMLTLLAKLGTPVMVGQFALGLAIAAPVITFTNLALRQVQATDARGDYQFGDYLALRFAMTLFGLLIIAGVVGVTGYGGQTALVILMMGLAKACEAVSDVFYGLFQFHERMDRMAISMMLKGAFSLTVLGVAVVLTRSVFWGVFGLASAWLLLLVIYDVPMGRRTLKEHRAADATGNVSSLSIRPRWRVNTLKTLLWLTLPLGFATMFNVLSANIPRYFVERMLGQRELGIFAAMTYVMFAGTTVVGALGQSACPRLARYYLAGDAAGFRGLLLKLTGIGAFIGIGFILITLLAGRPLLTLLYTAEYAGRIDVFFWLNVAATLAYMASGLGYGMTTARYFKQQPYIYAATSALGAVACAILVPRYHILGAALATALMFLGLLAGNAGCIWHALHRIRPHTEPVMADAGIG